MMIENASLHQQLANPNLALEKELKFYKAKYLEAGKALEDLEELSSKCM